MSDDATYDPATKAGKVRLLISDVGGSDSSSFLFTDAEINTFLELRGDNIKKAASSALRTMAGNEVMISKVIKWQDLSTDGAKVSDSLLKYAAILDAEGEEDYLGDFAQLNVNEFSNRYLREVRRANA